MTYDQALEQVRHAIYGKDVREAIAYLFANTKDVDPKLNQYSTNAIQNKAVWEEFQKAYQKIEKVDAATKVDPSLSQYSENAIQNKSVWAEFQNAYLKIAQLGTTGVAGSVTIGLEDAAGDGITDDTEALNKALNHSNCVIDGGNRKYKYMSLLMENVENVTIRNVIFWKGQQLDVAGCKNIRFENCTWDGINNNGSKDVWTWGVRLRERRDSAGNEIWCENVWIEHCIFREIWYNPYVNNGRPCDVTGIAILPRSVHNLYIRHNFFTQNKGNACVHWNSWKKNGYAEVTDNTFYLNAYGGVGVFAVQQQFPKVKGRVCNNQFIGCGLGYLPQEWFDMIPLPENMLGQGCAGLLGGAGTQAAPKKWTFVCENNVFEDCVESSIEGPTWNPCIGNSITGQGAGQTEENCRKMEEKYHLDYKLKPRPIDSVNFIYRNYYKDADGTYPNDEGDPIVFMNNTMGIAHVQRQSYIQFKGEYNVPLIFIGNVMRTAQPHVIDTHFLFCNFKAGIRFENNDGIYPFFNNCTFEGDVVLDDMLSAYQSDFTKANIILNQSKRRFPETWFQLYDPAKASLENDQAAVKDGYAVLSACDVYEKTEPPEDAAYNIRDEKKYSQSKGYVFGGPKNPESIDTGIELLKGGKDWTIYCRFDGKGKAETPSTSSSIMSLFTVYDALSKKNPLLVGGQWSCVATALRTAKGTVALDSGHSYTLRGMKLLMCKSGNTIRTWLAYSSAEADALKDGIVSTYTVEAGDGLSGAAGTLRIGNQSGYDGVDSFALYGAMKEFQVFLRALTDDEIATLFYGHTFQSGNSEQTYTPVYDISKDKRYNQTDGYLQFDGTFGIDTGVELFKNDKDFTILLKCRFDNFHDDGLHNFTFVPAISCMNYTDDLHKSPGFSIGLLMLNGDDPNKTSTGGFINIRNYWSYSNNTSVDMSSYFSYPGKDYDFVIMRKDGELSIYSFYMQRYITIKGNDAESIFDGTLRIGEHMTVPKQGDNVKFKGRIYDCRVYDAALSTNTLENMFPNIYSNEKKTKGELRAYIANPQYKKQRVYYLYLEVFVDMGDFGTAEYAGKYPKAIGIKINGIWGLNDVYWMGTGSNGHLKKWLYTNGQMNPYESISVSIVNTGLCPKLKARVVSFRCSALTEVTEPIEALDALGFNIEWEKEELSLAVGETLDGHVTYMPEDATTGTELTIEIEGEAVSAEVKDHMVTIKALAAGEATVTISIPAGAKMTCTFTVT